MIKLNRPEFTVTAEINADDEYDFVVRYHGKFIRKFKNQKQAEDYRNLLQL